MSVELKACVDAAADVVNSHQRRVWSRYLRHRKQVVRTSWLLRGMVILGILVLLIATHQRVLTALGRSLVYRGPVAASDAIVLEHYDPDYLVFEKARDVMQRELTIEATALCETSRTTRSQPRRCS